MVSSCIHCVFERLINVNETEDKQHCCTEMFIQVRTICGGLACTTTNNCFSKPRTWRHHRAIGSWNSRLAGSHEGLNRGLWHLRPTVSTVIVMQVSLSSLSRMWLVACHALFKSVHPVNISTRFNCVNVSSTETHRGFGGWPCQTLKEPAPWADCTQYRWH